jgi:hypothetical protein
VFKGLPMDSDDGVDNLLFTEDTEPLLLEGLKNLVYEGT